jgi:hypothetical protein
VLTVIADEPEAAGCWQARVMPLHYAALRLSPSCYRCGSRRSGETWARRGAFVLIASWAAAFAWDAMKGKGSMLTKLTTGKYRTGQVWRFKTRPGEEDATLTVVRVESSEKLGVIVHVSVEGVRIESPGAPGGFSDTLQHCPFSEEAIEESVTTLVGEAETLPAFEEGYRMWREAFDAGEASIFSTTVAEAVGAIESAINQNQ